MRSFALFPALIFLLTSFEPRPVNPEICLSSEEQKLYRLIMDYRKSQGLPPIPLSSKLTQVAQTHAKDLSENYQFSPKNKCNPHSWSKNGKWVPCCYTNDHKEASCMWTKPKEIAAYEGNGFEIAYYSSLGASAQEGIDGWKLSAGHNPLLINSGTWSNVTWNAIGIGIYKEYGLVWFGEVKDEGIMQTCK